MIVLSICLNELFFSALHELSFIFLINQFTQMEAVSLRQQMHNFKNYKWYDFDQLEFILNIEFSSYVVNKNIKLGCLEIVKVKNGD